MGGFAHQLAGSFLLPVLIPKPSKGMNTKGVTTLVFVTVLALVIGFWVGQDKSGPSKLPSENLQGKSNDKLLYGDTGLPKNCRAIIKSNIDGYKSKEWTAEEALGSIDRNCGEFGYAW